MLVLVLVVEVEVGWVEVVVDVVWQCQCYSKCLQSEQWYWHQFLLLVAVGKYWHQFLLLVVVGNVNRQCQYYKRAPPTLLSLLCMLFC